MDECKICGNEMSYYPGRVRKYCSSLCRNKGFVGYKHTEETKVIMRSRVRPKLIETKEERIKRLSYNTKQWRERHPDRVKVQRLKQYRARKQKAFLVIGGAVCKRCGCDELDFLEFNHTQGGGCKEHRNNKCKPMIDRILTFRRKTNDLECLCRVCNAIDYLEKKNPEKAKYYKVRYEEFTDGKAVKL